ncbi:sulfotransferase 2B1-like [Sceloporus undulatus]|uniref:sulfotransferase 2B1-like n=1 Tax=Sceloporus undulatus TaxID=8520 RepID=UPI001C4C9EC7|nr:sulfotransferase 2B1-like [Sceloporus undulatus]XP_042296133.1 sulfotransferase 2B1-like [Sceloporus undulatus]
MTPELYITYKGILFPSMRSTVETLNYVENEFQLLDEDILLVTYPKSGTVWMLEILGLIQHSGDPSWVHSTVVWERAPWINTNLGLELALKYPPPRLLTTHLPFQISPKSLLHSEAKVIYTLRNPKDVLISYYHFAKLYDGLKDPGTVEEFLEEFLSGNVPIGSWFDHVKGWLEMKDRSNFFFITYEELQKDLRGSVEKICHFLGKEINRQQIDAVVENASFQKMKDNKMSNFSNLPDAHFNHKEGKFMRKGICEDWKNHLTVKQSKHFDCVYQEKMKDVNVAFPWG